MFDQKQKDSAVISAENNKEGNLSNDIFKELSWDLDFWKEKTDLNQDKVKDKEYYINLSLSILWVLNVILIIFMVLSFFYISIQKNTSYYSSSLIDPFCAVILWSYSDKNTWDYCSSVSALKQDYITKTNELKNWFVLWIDKVKWLDDIFLDLYTLENFKSSKEWEFLTLNKLNKLKVVNILNDFDRLKNDFSAWDKKMVECKNIKITSDNILTASCDIFSSSWETVDLQWGLWIIWDSWNKKDLIWWTSISTAASFLNFIEKNPTYNFQVISKQKIFSSDFAWEWPYVRKTKLELELKYNNLKNNLSL